MSRRCELTGKAVLTGNKVSHSNRKTRTRFLPNLLQVTLISDALGRAVRLRVAAAALRSVEHRGGLDAFLVKAKADELSIGAAKLKREIEKKHAEAKAAAPQTLASRASLRGALQEAIMALVLHMPSVARLALGRDGLLRCVVFAPSSLFKRSSLKPASGSIQLGQTRRGAGNISHEAKTDIRNFVSI